MAKSSVEEIFPRIRTIIAERLEITPETITLQSSLDDLGGDSLDIFEVIMALEEEFETEINEDAQITNVGELVEIFAGRKLPDC